MEITTFAIDHYDDLLSLWGRCGLPYEKDGRDSREQLDRQILDDHVAILVLKDDDGRLIGSVIGTFDGRRGWINRLAVDPEYRGRRLAARLVEKAEALDPDDFDDDYGDFEDDDDNSMVMSIKNALDCIGCEACSRVCPKDCFTHEHKAAA